MHKSKFTKIFGYMISLYELLWQFCFKKVQLFHIFPWKWRPRSLCVSRIYTANQWIDVYHAHFTGERKLYVKTGHIYKVTATNLSINLGLCYSQWNKCAACGIKWKCKSMPKNLESFFRKYTKLCICWFISEFTDFCL